MRALLIIDTLKDFCPGGSLPVPEGDQVMGVINRLSREGNYDLIVLVREEHGDGHVSFVESHPGAKLYQRIIVNGVEQILWPKHCVAGTPGAEVHPDLDLSAVHVTVKKGLRLEVDSYSGFRDNAGGNPTELESIIERAAKAAGVDRSDVEVDSCGLALDYCVSATAIDAAELGFKSRVIFDATRPVDPSPDAVRAVLSRLQDRGVEVVTSREIIQGRAREKVCERPLNP